MVHTASLVWPRSLLHWHSSLLLSPISQSYPRQRKMPGVSQSRERPAFSSWFVATARSTRLSNESVSRKYYRAKDQPTLGWNGQGEERTTSTCTSISTTTTITTTFTTTTLLILILYNNPLLSRPIVLTWLSISSSTPDENFTNDYFRVFIFFLL